ncbi:hypothetical protein AVEN_197310-1 [Araneus ventricosus]|uniref:Uncharacterized protein n=1 Tax=Araneus ventricosus TaxID=182803 RepID=A0A4Y2EZW2_ARAVE|nr:hypothetical protein AVEN_197310-1 [Araneus ventricosus]
MATTKDSEIKALNSESTIVVKAKTDKKNRLSRKKKILPENMETDSVKGSSLRKMGKYSKVKEPFAIPWGDTPFQVNPEASTSALPAADKETVKLVLADDTLAAAGVADNGPPSQSELFKDDGESVHSDVSSDGTTDSNQYYEIPGTPQAGQENLLKQYYLKDKLVPQPNFATGTKEARMDEDPPAGTKRRRPGKVRGNKKKLNKGPVGGLGKKVANEKKVGKQESQLLRSSQSFIKKYPIFTFQIPRFRRAQLKSF